MTQEHLITPPPKELVEQWRLAPEYAKPTLGQSWCAMVTMTTNRLQEIAAKAARWGADQELEACCESLRQKNLPVHTEQLRTARRPKPLSDKQRGLAALSEIMSSQEGTFDGKPFHVLEGILMALPD